MPGLHRNNAAEWAMVAVLTPVAWAVRLSMWVVRCVRIGGRRGTPGKAGG